jgi:hypothetical protein
MHVHANQINPSTQLDRDEDGREKTDGGRYELGP